MPEQVQQLPQATPATPIAQGAQPPIFVAPPTRSAAQKRAAHALAKVQALQIEGKEAYGNYVSFAKSLPAAIVMCGLGQALAFELAQGKGAATTTQKGHCRLAEHLCDWLLRGWEHSPYSGQSNILSAIVGKDASCSNENNYVAAQAEALLYLDWLKKFAVALLEKGDDER